MSRQSVRRLEGASDPDDMVAIAAIVCPACATRGVLVLGFGPSSSLVDAETLQALRDGSHESDLPPDAFIRPIDRNRDEDVSRDTRAGYSN